METEQHKRLTKELAKAFARASGYDVNENEVSQWEVASDLLIKSIEGIVDNKLVKAFETMPKPTTGDYAKG